MRITEVLKAGRCFSFEFFPPKSARGVEKLMRTVGGLRDLNPSFVSVTYGAAGSTRTRTLDLVQRIQEEHGLTAMAHLTCVGHTSEELDEILGSLWDSGIRNLMALRGDPPKGDNTFVPTQGGFSYASDLIAHVKDNFDFTIGAGCYPEGHPETPDRLLDLDHLETKVAAGVDFLVTQMIFDNEFYSRFMDEIRERGITVPVLPGIMPVTNTKQIKRFANFSGTSLPARLLFRLARADPEDAVEVGFKHAFGQCLDLLTREVPGIHFYTLNKERSTRMILEKLIQWGVAP